MRERTDESTEFMVTAWGTNWVIENQDKLEQDENGK